jgi:hypothetical protein
MFSPRSGQSTSYRDYNQFSMGWRFCSAQITNTPDRKDFMAVVENWIKLAFVSWRNRKSEADGYLGREGRV